MTSLEPLQPFLANVARCTSREELTGLCMDTMVRAFGIRVGAVVFIDGALAPQEVALHGTRQSMLDEYNQHWRDDDPVLAAVLARRTPVHDGQLYDPEAWRRMPLLSNYGRRIDVDPYMSAPIYGHGALAGVVNFCRGRHGARFTSRELTLAAVLCGHFSASLAGLPRHREAEALPLTARERQIAILAARGLKNPAIAAELGIARETVKQALGRVYQKLDVSGRAAMAALLVKRGWL